ncbi:AraC family transcriptional regulator [Clostridium boliviensis]|uniref:AraC family transcriptional regulator n=1 Tax=Clostridium boliviensis TaxID=318465 RepID=A0ABU4GTE9_9CLOT|nr:AraC family transcriptional regulator [Clostridium boliviensis]MDW2800896.1 AraC family transcriptional regulator [Clostridium boliviensis]
METGIEKPIDKTLEKQTELVQLIRHYAQTDGSHLSAITHLHFTRTSYLEGPVYAVQGPALCIIVQGAKKFTVAENSYYYDPFHYLVVSLDLPYIGQIIQADPKSPLLCMSLQIEPELIFDIMQDTSSTISEIDSHRGIFIGEITLPLIDACCRLVRLLDTPQDIPALSALIIREIFYRILQAEQGDFLKQIGIIGSYSRKIAEITGMIKEEFDKPLRIERLAQAANMSVASLYRHFKQVTAMSPLQYQKQLRLREARRLLMSSHVNAADAGFQVGYESPSQFSREYARMFGLPPKIDAKHMHDLLCLIKK